MFMEADVLAEFEGTRKRLEAVTHTQFLLSQSKVWFQLASLDQRQSACLSFARSMSC